MFLWQFLNPLVSHKFNRVQCISRSCGGSEKQMVYLSTLELEKCANMEPMSFQKVPESPCDQSIYETQNQPGDKKLHDSCTQQPSLGAIRCRTCDSVVKITSDQIKN